MGVERVDVLFKAVDLRCQDAQPFSLPVTLRNRQIGAEIEQIILHPSEHGIDERDLRQMKSRDTDRGIGFIDGSVSADAQIVFRAALSAAERGRAVIAGARVDAVENNHRLDPLSRVEFVRPVNQLLPSAQTASMAMTIAMN